MTLFIKKSIRLKKVNNVKISNFRIIPESPRWLLSRGKTEQAEKIIQKCAKVNGVTLPEKIIDKETIDDGEKQSVLKMFTSARLLIRTLIIYLNWYDIKFAISFFHHRHAFQLFC